MSWRSITDADLNAAKLAPLVSALRTAAIGDGQADPVNAIKATVVSRIRLKIQACASNVPDADESFIPDSLIALACRMILREAKSRLEMDLTDTEKKAWDVDERDLREIAACNLPVEAPTTATTPVAQSTQPSPSITCRTKRFSRADQEGA